MSSIVGFLLYRRGRTFTTNMPYLFTFVTFHFVEILFPAINNCWKKYPTKMKCNKCKQVGHITSKCPTSSTKEEANYATQALPPSEKMF